MFLLLNFSFFSFPFFLHKNFPFRFLAISFRFFIFDRFHCQLCLLYYFSCLQCTCLPLHIKPFFSFLIPLYFAFYKYPLIFILSLYCFRLFYAILFFQTLYVPFFSVLAIQVSLYDVLCYNSSGFLDFINCIFLICTS